MNKIILDPLEWQSLHGANQDQLFTNSGDNRFWATVSYLLDDRTIRPSVDELECASVEIVLKGKYVLRVEAQQTGLESTLIPTSSDEKIPEHIATLVAGLNGRIKHGQFWAAVGIMLNGRWADGDSRMVSIALNSTVALNLVFNEGKIQCGFAAVLNSVFCFDTELVAAVKMACDKMFTPGLNLFQARSLMRKHLTTTFMDEYRHCGELDAQWLLDCVFDSFSGGFEADVDDGVKISVEWQGLGG